MTLRKTRPTVRGFSKKGNKGFLFGGGDVLQITLLRAGQGFFFEGLCLAIKKKSLSHKDSSILLRNFMEGNGIEVNASYYYDRIYGLNFIDFRRKRQGYTRGKLYYLRLGEAKDTLV